MPACNNCKNFKKGLFAGVFSCQATIYEARLTGFCYPVPYVVEH